jgi:hypothetical protein
VNCPGDVSDVIEKDILVALDNPDIRVMEMIGHPGSGDEGFGMCVGAVDAHSDGF